MLRRRNFVPRLRALESRLAPALFTVTNLNNFGADSLRNCITQANGAAGADTITFQFGLTGTIKLSGDIAISDTLVIVGPGAPRVTIDGGAVDRIFDTSSAKLGTAISIQSLKLTGGAAADGGAIFVGDEDLVVSDCVITANAATGSGGGIHVDTAFAPLTITRTTISDNTAAQGGGVSFAGGVLTVDRCTVSGNDATAGGGGGLFSDGKSLGMSVLNSTFSGNTATGSGGGIELVNFLGVFTVQSSTITQNSAADGGGISRTSGLGTLDIESSIVASNPNAAGQQILSTGTVNFDFSAVNSTNGFTVTGGNNLIGGPFKLGPLAANGGPTLTHLPAGDSPLLDAGSNPTGAGGDQRSAQRTVGSQTDIGAVEAVNLVVFNDNNAGPGSLRQAVSHADSVPGPDTITFDAAFAATDDTITLTTGDIDVDDEVTIVGPGAKAARVSGNKSGRILDFTAAPAGSFHSVSGLSFTDGQAGTGGAILLGDEGLILTECAFVGNTVLGGAFDVGGAVAVNGGGGLTLLRCTLSGNTADAGGAVGFYPDAGILTVDSSTLSGNAATISGGALFMGNNGAGNIVVRNSTVAGNTAAIGAGVFRAAGVTADVTLRSSVVSSNATPAGAASDVFTNGQVIADFSAVGTSAGVGTFTADATTKSLLGQNLKLGPLADNGGPTKTHLPATDSPLRDKGSSTSGVLTDQRGAGFARVWNGIAEIGAVELPPRFVVLNDNDAGPDSLRQQIVDANALAGAQTITFNAAAFAATDETITLTSGRIHVFDDVAVVGPGARRATVSGNNASNIISFSAAAAGSVHAVSGLTFAGGNAVGSAGALFVGDESLTLTDCAFIGNTSNLYAAVGVSAAGSLIARRCTFTGNSGSVGTIGVTNLGGTLLLENCTLAGNSNTLATVYFFGPGGSGATVRNSTIVNNSSTGGTAGIFFNGNGASTLTIESSVIAGNSGAPGYDIGIIGTAVANFSAIGTVSGSTFVPDAATTALLGQDFKLGTLADHGGPTDTVRPLDGSPLINAGSNPGGLLTDQRGQPRVSGLTDIGAFELQPPANVTAVVVGDGTAQRSSVTRVRVVFNSAVLFAGDPAAAFALNRQSDGKAVNLTATLGTAGPGTEVNLYFTGGAVNGASLADGRYTLTAIAAQFNGDGLDGNGDGVYGDNYVLVGDPAVAPKLYRLFGDADGDGDVDAVDYGAFRAAFGSSPNSVFDADGDADVDAVDFGQFRQRFGSSI